MRATVKPRDLQSIFSRWSTLVSRTKILRLPTVYETVLVVLLFIVSVFGVMLVWRTIDQADREVAATQNRLLAESAAQQGGTWLEAFLTDYVEDLCVIANSRSIQLALDRPRQFDALIQDFSAWIASKREIVQLRYLDPGGQELVRVDRVGDDIVVYGEEALQNKSSRYYFRDAVSLGPSSVYVSALDLNIEHDQIVEPWQPMLRLAVPVFDSAAAGNGVLVINLDAQRLVRRLSTLAVAPTGPVEFLNSDGYWLGGVDEERLWGFMFGNEHRIGKAQPHFWEEMKAGTGLGVYEDDGRNYAFLKFDVRQQIEVNTNFANVVAQDPDWYIIVAYPDPPAFLRRDNLGEFVLIALGCGLFAAFVARIISARKAAEQRVRQAERHMLRTERLAGLGSIVGSVAHELNTPIGNALVISTTVGEHARALKESVESGRVGRNRLQSLTEEIDSGSALVQKSLARAAETVRYFKQIAVDQVSERRRSFSLRPYILDTISLLRPQFKGGKIILRDGDLVDVTLDSYPGPLGQVIENLVMNARIHAFDEEMAAGTITVSAHVREQGLVTIIVSDNGRGIDEAKIGRVFDPFYTTRLGQGGSGLGLTIVHNIVTGILGGEIEIFSTPGQGTRVAVTIPREAPSRDTSEPVYKRKRGTA